VSKRSGQSHRRSEERSLALHRAVAEHLRRSPQLVQIAHANLERWIRLNGPQLAYLEWQGILKAPLDDVIALICEDSEHAARLRQSSPFAGILSEEERLRIFDAFKIGSDQPERNR